MGYLPLLDVPSLFAITEERESFACYRIYWGQELCARGFQITCPGLGWFGDWPAHRHREAFLSFEVRNGVVRVKADRSGARKGACNLLSVIFLSVLVLALFLPFYLFPFRFCGAFWQIDFTS